MKRHIHHTAAAPDSPPPNNWRQDGACAEVDPDQMFPGSKPEDIAKAKAICERCPVYRKCLRDVIRHEGGTSPDRRHGVIAALTGPERFAVYRRLQRRGVLK